MRLFKEFKIIAFILALNLWFLHGLDMQYYTIRNDYLFDMNLFLAVILNLFCILLIVIK